MMARYFFASSLLFITTTALAQDLPSGVRDSQPAGDRPLPPAEALKKATVPEGFRVSLFAAEPDVRQPIAFTFDDRGRMWVVECFSYPDWTKFEGKDRVVILEDTDHDGRFDQRKVFLDNGKNLTSIAWGLGGIWLCSAPNLLFIPDRNGDDEPDGEPVVELDGWNYDKVSHNVFNGLTWGPDGWLYGCHGILADSIVGRPGTAEEQREKINCGVWRYHPTRKTFEAVAHGTTNPWGLDFDEYGEGFFANCVIEHMWHLVPGARYKRMFGQDYSPYVYDRIQACSDHLHWQGDDWNVAGSDGVIQTRLGGGHAHCGTMVYLGDNFPPEYRNALFTSNIHGRRLNHDRIVPRGSGFKAAHTPDFFMANDDWFRGVAVGYGPDGGVYVTDWNDLGECHDQDGVLRSSGRIYKIVYGQPKPPRLDLGQMSDEQLVDLHLHRNDWQVRQARLILQERAAEGEEMRDAKARLHNMLRKNPDVTRKLRAMWTLHALDALSPEQLSALLDHAEEHVRAWAIRFELEDRKADAGVLAKFATMAGGDPSALVRLALASGLQRLPVSDRWPIAERLALHAEDAGDANLPLMVWYGVEPAVARDHERAVAFIGSGRWPMVREFSARRLVEADTAAGVATLTQFLARTDETTLRLDVMRGMLAGLRGRKAQTPPGWAATYQTLAASPDRDVRGHARLLALSLGDQGVGAELRRIAADSSADVDARREAIEALVEQKDPRVVPILHALIGDRSLSGAALRGLAAFDHADTPRIILEGFAKLGEAERVDAVATLASRPAYAAALLDGVETGTLKPTDIPAYVARQVHGLNDPTLRERLGKTWGVVNSTSEDKQQLLAKLKAQLTPEALASADLAKGRAVFAATCASCHKLFGEGTLIGPDLTGSDRANLDYILTNVVDPGATVGRDFQLTTITMADGRSVAGVILAQNDASVTLRSATEQVVLTRSDIAAMVTLPVSMMPEGLLLTLTEEQTRDLVAYLASPKQVELPKP